METKLVTVGSLKKGSYVLIDGIASTVRDIQVSKPGKHGHAKSRIEAIGIINNEKKIIVKPSHDNIEVPIIEKKIAQVLSISGDTANVMDTETYETFDVKIPEEFKDQIEEGKQVSYWIISNNKIIKQIR
jgi:translation initiation factor 5A